MNYQLFSCEKTIDFLLYTPAISTVFEKALKHLEDEVHPDAEPVEASVEYRNHLCKALFYKFVLSSAGDRASPRLRSGGADVQREVSRGQQTYSTDPTEYPIGEPVQKLEGKVQCSGEAEYADDILKVPGELTAALVLSTGWSNRIWT